MDYICCNCEEIIEIPEILYDLTEDVICYYCDTPQNLSLHEVCTGCNFQVLKDLDYCPSCYKDKSIKINLPTFKYTYIKSEAQYKEAINFIESIDTLGLDTEGNGLDPFTLELFLIQIGNENMVYVFDYHWHKKLTAEEFWKDDTKLFIIHNAKFDYKVLKQKLGIEMINVFDTFLAERILTCGIERKNSLKEVTRKYLDIELDKALRMDFTLMTTKTFDDRISEDLIEYSAKDVQLLPIIYRLQKWKLLNDDLMRVAYLEFETCKIVGDIELAGIYVNTNGWKDIIKENQEKKREIERQIYELLEKDSSHNSLFGDDKINLNSTKVLLETFKKLGISITSTKESDLLQIDHSLAKLMLEYRKYEKQLSSFGESFLKLVRKETSRIHPTFQQIGADTGRFSCNKPNIQQIPAEHTYRECFCAPEGRKIISCDYSQQELRVLASLSKDPKFIKFYEDGVDLHTATASMMFNIPIEKVEKDKHRKVAKTINFGLAYGQGAKKLGLTIGVDEQEAIKMIDKYFAQFSYIKEWLDTAAKGAQTSGYSKTLMGRKRFYKIPDKSDDDYKVLMSAIGRQGKNSPIQGSGADMTKLALIKINRRFKDEKINAFLTSIVHDEIVAEASIEDAEIAGEIIRSCMVEAGDELAPNVVNLAEVGIYDSWKH